MNTEKEELDKLGDNIHELLVENPIKGKLPENMFVAEFLPYFTGELSIDKDSSVFQYWVGIAGSPTAEVDIIDSKGDTLYTVPAVFSTDSIDTVNQTVRPISDVMAEYEQRNERFSTDAENFLEANLRPNIKDSNTLTETGKRWNDIFKRYGKEYVETEPESVRLTPEEDMDDFDYGEED